MTTWLAAAANPTLAAGNSLFAQIPAEFLFHLSVVSGAVILLWLGVNWVERLRVHWSLYAQTPADLFRELCQAHELERGCDDDDREVSERDETGDLAHGGSFGTAVVCLSIV